MEEFTVLSRERYFELLEQGYQCTSSQPTTILGKEGHFVHLIKKPGTCERFWRLFEACLLGAQKEALREPVSGFVPGDLKQVSEDSSLLG